MQLLLTLSRGIDWLNALVGRLIYWLILVAVVISAGNATVRYLFNMSSNAWLEVQWYLFSAVFLLAAGYTLQRNEHIRIDVVIGRFSRRVQAWVDIFGTIVFLMPMAILILYLSLPMFWQSFLSGEVSSNAGGLVRWPVKLLVPMGFGLLILQAISELIKRFAFLAGEIDDYGPQAHGHGQPPLQIDVPGERP